MKKGAITARATLDGWREQRADQLAPLRFHLMDALEKRASGEAGELRRVLDERVSALLAAYAEDVALVTTRAQPARATDSANARPLAELLDYLAGRTAKRAGDVVVFNPAPEGSALPVLPALEEFRQTWSTVRSESRLQQSLAFVPTGAGPLNSAALVHRSMALMREVSPAYLQHFLAYVDDLSWLDKIDAAAAERPAPAATPGNKRLRKKGAS